MQAVFFSFAMFSLFPTRPSQHQFFFLLFLIYITTHVHILVCGGPAGGQRERLVANGGEVRRGDSAPNAWGEESRQPLGRQFGEETFPRHGGLGFSEVPLGRHLSGSRDNRGNNMNGVLYIYWFSFVYNSYTYSSIGSTHNTQAASFSFSFQYRSSKNSKQ